MEVKIITIHDPDVNYGSTLQSCGLYNFITDLGYNAEIINYKPNYKTLSQRIKGVASKLLFFRKVRSRRCKINKYLDQHAKLTRLYRNAEELDKNPPVADVYITGSDVIWNRDINPEGADSSFYLGFVKEGIKMSYAPSMGEIQPIENIKYVADQIHDFKFISVREEQSKEQLIKYGIKNVMCVLDPVFLLDKRYYEKQVLPNSYGEYTLVYLMSDTPEKRSFVDNISRKYGDPVIAFGGLKQKSKCDAFIRDAGVEDFLSLIYNAQNIVTDSFHCIAFSLIFEKQFLYLPSIDSSMRIENLLNYVNLEYRIVNSQNALDNESAVYECIDYEKTRLLLNNKIIESKTHLTNALNECQSEITKEAIDATEIFHRA